VIIGAAGMDYHVFNRVYRDNPAYDVKAFTMAVEQNLGTGKPQPAMLAIAGSQPETLYVSR
jgi:predicted GTPase